MLYAKVIGRIAVFTCKHIAHLNSYFQTLFPKILAIFVIKESRQRCSRQRVTQCHFQLQNMDDQSERSFWELNKSACEKVVDNAARPK